MVKLKRNPAEYRQILEKKLNSARKPGFNFSACFEQSDGFTEQASDVTTAQLLDYLDNTGYKYVGKLNPLHDCMVIACDTIPFKLLNFPTMWIFEPYYNSYNFYFHFDEKIYTYLEENLKSESISVFCNYAPIFNKYKMLKLCSDWGKYSLPNLPQPTPKQIEQILDLDEKFVYYQNLHFPINNPNGKYRMPTAIVGRLACSVLPINTLIIFEHLLEQMSVSTAILDNSDVAVPYLIDLKVLSRNSRFVGKKEKKALTIKKALEELKHLGFVDDYFIDMNNIVVLSTFVTKHIRQQIQRKQGFYKLIPPTKQAPFVATFINYLSWIINSPAHYEQLTISLETLLCKHLRLKRLLKEHRLSEIAKVLNLLRKVGADYGLLELPENAQEITSKDIKYLLKNKTRLHKFIQLKVQPKAEKEEK